MKKLLNLSIDWEVITMSEVRPVDANELKDCIIENRRMTNKEAIANLNHIYGIVSSDIQRSLDLAIKALEERQKGEWIEHENHIECDQCRVWFLKDHLIRKNYCPNCGAEMKIKQISPDSGIREFDKKFADLLVFKDQPQRQLKSSDVHEDV